MKRRAGEREKELKVPSLCFLLRFSPEERARGEPSSLRLLRGSWGCKGQSEPAHAPAALVLEREPRASGLRGRREVYCEREVAQAPSYLSGLHSRGGGGGGAGGGCRPALPEEPPPLRALATAASSPPLRSGAERPAAAPARAGALAAGALAGHGPGSRPFPRGFPFQSLRLSAPCACEVIPGASGGWGPEEGLPDRCGRAVGVAARRRAVRLLGAGLAWPWGSD